MRTYRGYKRVSTDEQASNFSLPAQHEAIERSVRSEGATAIVWYEDAGFSAKSFDRPAMKRLLDEIRSGDVLYVYKLDRLTRSVRDLQDLLDRSEKTGFSIRSVNDRIDTSTANGRFFLRMIIEVAQWERETIGERSSMGIKRKVTDGIWRGGPIPFGYNGVPSERVKNGKPLLMLTPDEKTRHIVEMIFDRYVSGHGTRSIARWLNDDLGMRTGAGAKWTSRAVIRILYNEIYVGEVTHGKRAKGTIIRVQGEHEPIISRDLFDRTQEIIVMRKDFAPRQATGEYPLTGVARCGPCGATISGFRKRHRTGYYNCYRCLSYQSGRGCSPDTPLTTISAKRVEASFVEAVEQLGDPAYADVFFAEWERTVADRTGTTRAEIERLQRDLAEAERAVDRWTKPYEDGKLEWDDYERLTSPHKERVKTIKAQLDRYDEETPPLPSKASLIDIASTFGDRWAYGSPGERKIVCQTFVRAFGLTPYVFPDYRVEIRPSL